MTTGSRAVALAAAVLALIQQPGAAAGKTENVIVVMTDGLRWQEVFTGADPMLLNKEHGGIPDPAVVRSAFWRETPEQRRAALMPFLWGVVARDGQIWGNPANGSVARATNGLLFSYPGYSEALAGWPDPRIRDNDPFDNPNVTVLEWLNIQPELRGRVAAFASWGLFPYILNQKRSGLYVNAGWQTHRQDEWSPVHAVVNQLAAEMAPTAQDWRFDALTFHAAQEYLRTHRPRVLFVCFDETDDHAHEGRDDRVLYAARRVDGYVKRLWETVESLPEYRGRTSLVLATDHGRGSTPSTWKDHGKGVSGAEGIWIAVMGPDTPALGERRRCAPVTQGQIAATIAALLGLDYGSFEPRAAPPLADAVPHARGVSSSRARGSRPVGRSALESP